MKEKKKKPLLFRVVGFIIKAFLVIAAAFAGTNFAATGVSRISIKKKMKKVYEDGNNLMQSVTFGNSNVDVNDKTDNVFISASASNVNVDLIDMPVKDGFVLELYSIFSNITIHVPEGVRVIVRGTDKNSNITNTTKDLEGDYPVYELIKNNVMLSNVTIVVAEEDED